MVISNRLLPQVMGSDSWGIKVNEEMQEKNIELNTRRRLILDDGLTIRFLPPLDM
jgi:hypothetical protein